MSFGTPSLLIKNPSGESVLFFKSKVQFKVSKFKEFKSSEKATGEIEIPQIGAKCLLHMIPLFQSGSGSVTKLTIIVSGFCEEFQTPNKYQITISVFVRGVEIVSSRGISIRSEKVQCDKGYANCKEYIEKLDSAGNLVLDVEISLFINEASSLPIHIRNWNIDCKKLVGDLGRMLATTEFSDFKFIVKGKEFKVHRVILAAASSVFSTMFKAGLKETKSNECIIEDIEPEIFEHLLHFIYERKLPENLAEVAMNLYEAAHYYEIPELKEICFQEIPRQLNAENAVEKFNWGCKYNEDLKREAWKIIKWKILKFYLPSTNEPPATPEALQKMILKKKEMDKDLEEFAKLL